MYSCECDTLELVRKAQLGDRDSLNRLAETVRVRLYEYVFRLTLQDDLTQDIVQETILEMLRLFRKLRQADRFWAWLQGIAFNKVRNHFGRQWRRRTKSLSQIGECNLPWRNADGDLDLRSDRHGDDVLADLVTDELKQIVLRCIEALEPRQRAILTMRCYDNMSYAEIARMMECSEIGARALFYRAKKALTTRLSRHGLGKGALLMALVIFGKMTAAGKAAAAEISVTASTVSVGPTAALLATATSKTGIVTMAVIAAVGVGSVGGWGLMGGGSSRRVNLPSDIPDPRSALAVEEGPPSERWYYFPEGPHQPVMMRLVQFDDSGEDPASLVLENQYANYHFDYGTNTVHIKNHRMWEEGLRVRRLPTDSAALSSFLSQVEGYPAATGPAAAYGVGRLSNERGILIVCRREDGQERKLKEVDRHLNVLEEEYFQFGWPQSARRIDERDAIHRQGRAYFRIQGQINGVTLSGVGRLPLVYAASRLYYPYLEVRIGRRLRAVDTKEGTVVYDQDNRIVTRYAGGSFFKGLARPWLGLHSVDTIRRDAAEQQLQFQTQLNARAGEAKVVVQSEPAVMTYTVDLKQDWVTRIELGSGAVDGRPEMTGALTFTYFEDEESAETRFREPQVSGSGGGRSKAPGMLWLPELVNAYDGATP